MNWVFRWSFTLRFQAICRFLIQATRWARDERTCKEPRDWSMKNQLKDWKISTHLQVFVVCFDVVELRLRNYDLTEIVTGDFTDQKKQWHRWPNRVTKTFSWQSCWRLPGTDTSKQAKVNYNLAVTWHQRFGELNLKDLHQWQDVKSSSCQLRCVD